MFRPDGFYNNKQELENHFSKYCDWCWGHGYGNCDICKNNKLKFIEENFKNEE